MVQATELRMLSSHLLISLENTLSRGPVSEHVPRWYELQERTSPLDQITCQMKGTDHEWNEAGETCKPKRHINVAAKPFVQ